MFNPKRPKLGLALGGSGSKTSFYIGFLEELDKAGVKIDFISASSGASIVASAYSCGTLPQLKKFAKTLDQGSVKQYINKGHRGGLYALDGMEEKMREFTLGKTFEEVRPLMSFVTVDIENGEQLDLCMGDIAKACRISCTLPGVFEPVKWGSRTLVDGGLLNLVPVSSLKQFPVDVTIGVDIPGTKFIFSDGQITMRKIFKLIRKVLFLDEFDHLFATVFGAEAVDLERQPGLFSVLSKSMDLAIIANKNGDHQDLACDLLITPEIPKLKPTMFFQFNPFYEMGKKCAREHLPRIKELINKKMNIVEKSLA